MCKSLGPNQRVASPVARAAPLPNWQDIPGCLISCRPQREDHTSYRWDDYLRWFCLWNARSLAPTQKWERKTIEHQGVMAQWVQVSSIMPRHTLNDCNSQQPKGEGHCHRKRDSPENMDVYMRDALRQSLMTAYTQSSLSCQPSFVDSSQKNTEEKNRQRWIAVRFKMINQTNRLPWVSWWNRQHHAWTVSKPYS